MNLASGTVSKRFRRSGWHERQPPELSLPHDEARRADESIVPTTSANNDAAEASAELIEESGPRRLNTVPRGTTCRPTCPGHRAAFSASQADWPACVKLLAQWAERGGEHRSLARAHEGLSRQTQGRSHMT